ncbi:hypothetical protein [Streptomyces sp. NPDC052496]|uniref:hypothetical protein n=1 Tax=Streptomyces sp. NPDC052496 TaxID=3154951 RepID=UPI00341AD33D
MTDPIGPTMAGGTQKVDDETGWTVTFYPDANNYALMSEGKPPSFYWLPTRLSLARDTSGDYKFNLTRFIGKAQNPQDKDTVGGVLGLTVTGAVPADVWERLKAQVIKQTENNTNGLWWKEGRLEPLFQPVIVTSNTVSLSNLALGEKGYQFLGHDENGEAYLQTSSRPGGEERTEPIGGAQPGDAPVKDWHWVLQGGGRASLDPTGETAFVALVGNYPAQLLYNSFKGTSVGIVFASSVMELHMWTPKIELVIGCEWQKIYQHFKSKVSVRTLWAKADIDAELKNLQITGAITVKIVVDETIPGSKEMSKTLRDHSDVVVEKFLEYVGGVIFGPAPEKDDTSSENSSEESPWGVGLKLKADWDYNKLNLSYTETARMAYLQTSVTSSSLTSVLRQDAGNDIAKERKYFPVINLDEWPEKLARVCMPVAAWGTDVYRALSVEVGYPDSQGGIAYESYVFKRPADDLTAPDWTYRTFKKRKDEVPNPPKGWEPDLTFVKRWIHFKEPDPTNQLVVFHSDCKQIAIDPEPLGTLLRDGIVEVRAVSNKIMTVQIKFLVSKASMKDRFVTVELEPVNQYGNTIEGAAKATFDADEDDFKKIRTWRICPVPHVKRNYRYQVTVTDFGFGAQWSSEWRTTDTSILKVRMPKQTDEGVHFELLDEDAQAAYAKRRSGS